MSFPIPTAAYVHIPFCRRRCFYCDFPVYVTGDRVRGEASHTISQYVDSICHEISITPTFSQPLRTVFFGGGTPSLLSAKQLEQILRSLEKRFAMEPKMEISMEIDPGTFDLAHIQGYKNAGVNRVSLGVQTFTPELLKTAGRSHSVEDIFAAIDMVNQVEIPEFSIDLISGLPHQSIEQWQNSLTKGVEIAPTHISIYDLTIEPGTVFGRYYQPGDHPLPADEITVKMYELGQEILTGAGYEHYEISNYAKQGHQCKHNRVYWQNLAYYGFGMGATSYIEGKRFSRPRRIQEYYQWLNDGAIIDVEVIHEDEELLETIMLGMRLAEGLNLGVLAEKFGDQKVEKIQKCLQPHVIPGWVKLTKDRLCLNDPQGFLFSNVVLGDLFAKLS
ncbi:radical SAM family heme chaperone HemW [Cylindrospermopsis curvispora]|uniref:Heme chaperone HemW n=1 Tax=Cylindrospermopsis curvispora GIHE-G1 TaxID=2666332 RepID=A0A7H0EXZ6_9CYAN|nr:radical SAM family heme chaperone HemW [Cylindrospermopsis curvispora]QNP28662.1 coproporphyrinogen III oxidase [Cylindrospermopsis curvispora GIHE-G1]BAZ88704.1 oxygen-independent coproporphyrinogen III oxidase [Raphidiopsis curvata NIES-932]